MKLLASLFFFLHLQILPIISINDPRNQVNRFYREPVKLNFFEPSLQDPLLRHTLSVYLPEAQGQYPLVFFVHGWAGNRTQLSSMARFLASNGFVGVSLSVKNRRQPEDWLPAIEAAIKLIKGYAEKPTSRLYGKVDFMKVALVGHSMGGAASLHYANRHPEIDSVIGLHPYNGASGLISFIGGENQVLTDKLYNHTASTLIFSGVDDFIAPPEKTYKFFEGLWFDPTPEKTSSSADGLLEGKPALATTALTIATGTTSTLSSLGQKTTATSAPTLKSDSPPEALTKRQGQFPDGIFLLLDNCGHIYPTEHKLKPLTDEYKSAYMVYQLLVLFFCEATLKNNAEAKLYFTPGTEAFQDLQTLLSSVEEKGLPSFSMKYRE